MQTRRGSNNGFTPRTSSSESGKQSPGELQLKSSLRGQDFSTQEAMLKPGTDLGSGVKSGPPSDKGEGTSSAPKVEGEGKPVQAKGLMSNLRSGGWSVTGYMPQMPLDDHWHASVFSEGAQGPKSDGLFFDGFHLTWGAAPGGSAPHIFYKHDGTLEHGRSVSHGQTRRYANQLAGTTRGKSRWPSLDNVIATANGKAGGIASTLGEEVSQERAIELEKEDEDKKLREAEELRLSIKRQEDERWVALENDKGKDQSVVAWMRDNGFAPTEYMYWGSTGKPKDSDKTHGELRRAEHDSKKPKVEKVEPVVEEVPVSDELETVVDDTPELEELVEEPKLRSEAPKTPTQNTPPKKTPPPQQQKKGGKKGKGGNKGKGKKRRN